jgi:hypothetical protein
LKWDRLQCYNPAILGKPFVEEIHTLARVEVSGAVAALGLDGVR